MTTPEFDVLAAIDALERDEIGELVTWQIEQGRKRGDDQPEPSFNTAPDGFAVTADTNVDEFCRVLGLDRVG